MYVSRLKLHNFRNIVDNEIEFCPGLNVLVGDNGMGKTNILESIYFISIGRSPRAVKDVECIAFDQTEANIKLDFVRNKIERRIDLSLYKNQKKALLLDNMPTKKLSDIIGHFGSVYFSPQELQIISGSPSQRRRFVDIINCQISPQYMQDLFSYQRAIKQRNNYLKLHKNSGYNIELESWDTHIAKLCASIIKRRQAFLNILGKIAQKVHQNITDNHEQISIKYQSCVDNIESASYDDIISEFLQKMKQNYDRDKVLEYTSFGCHNDDIDIILEYMDKDNITSSINLKKSGSQGQQRTAVLAMKLAEVEILKNEYDEPPVLLLDDVLGELDAKRQNALLNFCKDFQTIVTCTEWKYDTKCKIYGVKNGEIIKKAE